MTAKHLIHKLLEEKYKDNMWFTRFDDERFAILSGDTQVKIFNIGEEECINFRYGILGYPISYLFNKDDKCPNKDDKCPILDCGNLTVFVGDAKGKESCSHAYVYGKDVGETNASLLGISNLKDKIMKLYGGKNGEI